MHFQCKTSLLIGLLTITNSNRQVSEEEQTRKELKKDMDAINALVSSIRAASMALSSVPHNVELLKQLKDGMVKIKNHEESIETMLFSGK